LLSSVLPSAIASIGSIAFTAWEQAVAFLSPPTAIASMASIAFGAQEKKYKEDF